MLSCDSQSEICIYIYYSSSILYSNSNSAQRKCYGVTVYTVPEYTEVHKSIAPAYIIIDSSDDL